MEKRKLRGSIVFIYNKKCQRAESQEDPNNFILEKQNFNRLKYILTRIRCLRHAKNQHVILI